MLGEDVGTLHRRVTIDQVGDLLVLSVVEPRNTHAMHTLHVPQLREFPWLADLEGRLVVFHQGQAR